MATDTRKLKKQTGAGKGPAALLRRIFYAVFAMLFGVLFVQVVWGNVHYPHFSPWWVLLLTAVWLAAFYGVYRLCLRFAAALQKREAVFLVAAGVVVLLTQLWFYSQLAAYPTRDFERVFTSGVNYAVNGFIEEPYLTYFYRYPNNMPLTIVLQFIFRLTHKFGFDNFYVVGAVVNAAAYLATYTFVYLSARRLFGTARAFFAVGLLYLSLPLQCYIGIFYTDTLTMPFAAFGFYVYLRLRDAKTWKGRVIAALLLAGGIAFGAKLKYSVVLVLIAIGIDLLLRGQWKQLLLTGALFGVLFAGVSAVFDSYMYAHFLDKETSRDMATPFSAWIMMGLSGDGAHDPEDNYLVWQWGTQEEMSRQSVEEIKNRLAAHTPLSFLQFLNQKALKSFGSGNLDYTHTVADSPMNQTFLVECVSESGVYYQQFDTLVQGYYVALFLLIIAGAVAAWRKADSTAFVPYLAIFGLLLFLLLWESGNRYLINYYSMFILAGAYAMGALSGKAGERANA